MNECCSSLSIRISYTYLSILCLHTYSTNLNLGHANGAEYAYEEESGVMGYSYPSNEGPAGSLTCLNGANMWQLVWFPDDQLFVQESYFTSQSMTIPVDGFVLDESSGAPKVVRLQSSASSSNDLDLVFT
eukprot:scaffold4226_cov180-Amphora_coffeaeformis.AAC.12